MEKQLERIEAKLLEIETKINMSYESAEKMRKYFLWTFIIGIVVIVGPLFLLPLIIPLFLQGVSLPAGL